MNIKSTKKSKWLLFVVAGITAFAVFGFGDYEPPAPPIPPGYTCKGVDGNTGYACQVIQCSLGGTRAEPNQAWNYVEAWTCCYNATGQGGGQYLYSCDSTNDGCCRFTATLCPNVNNDLHVCPSVTGLPGGG